MSKVNWEFFLSRNNLTINEALKGVKSVEEASDYFERKGLSLPETSVLEEALAQNAQQVLDKAAADAEAKKKSEAPKPTKPRRTRSKAPAKSPARKTSGASESEDKDEKESQRYFRKVVPTKKSKK